MAATRRFQARTLQQRWWWAQHRRKQRAGITTAATKQRVVAGLSSPFIRITDNGSIRKVTQ